ncbi:glycerol kinase GlpK [Actinomadura graeca]|uniref:Glycerol kinase n=1 Tax=Actinomadura graeca TaxID=2750812 RepID=A0ABX8R4K1_9ACTN|nr:glycerol kinase GlpK [Actinomadura graeca]QXJ25995.1 glycerol kinase GlpK [Actinomadura graeca]
MADFVGALDQGTTSTRFMVFDHSGAVVARHQLEHRQILPRPGWVEHDPAEIWENTRTVIQTALATAGLSTTDLQAIGITNQRETTVVWDPRTGHPLHNAIVWQDTRTDQITTALQHDSRGQMIRDRTGLPPATYFSAAKAQWILDNTPGARQAAHHGHALMGTIDTWLLWNLTGGPHGGVHLTDPTNASRTMLMDLHTLTWDPELLDIFTLPATMLPAIGPSTQPGGYGPTHPDTPLAHPNGTTTASTGTGGSGTGGVPVTAILGDQQAATVGQVCFAPGEAKNTYGTGNFLLLNTGHQPVTSHAGMLTTVCYQLAGQPPVYALEGSIAVTGSAVQWLRDQLGLITDAAHSETLARQAGDNGGIYFVPAFSGLFAPYWRADARGAIVGLSRHTTAAHLARATLEAICYQTRDVVEAMHHDSGVTLEVLKVDGGVTTNHLCMQLQADILGVPVSRPTITETTALGAAYAAGLATGLWHDTDELRTHWHQDHRWEPTWTPRQRDHAYTGWKKAVERTYGWIDID